MFGADIFELKSDPLTKSNCHEGSSTIEVKWIDTTNQQYYQLDYVLNILPEGEYKYFYLV